MENEIYHHGVKGQKWGVRRYTNSDGSLTSAGKRKAKESARAYYKAQTNKLGMKDSVTEKARNKHAKSYEKNMSKYKEGINAIGKKNVDSGMASASTVLSNPQVQNILRTYTDAQAKEIENQIKQSLSNK